MASFAYIDSEKWSKLNRLKSMIQRYFKEPLLQLTGELGRPAYTLADRKRLVRLLTQDMQRGDILITKSLTCFGNTPEKIQEVLSLSIRQGINICFFTSSELPDGDDIPVVLTGMILPTDIRGKIPDISIRKIKRKPGRKEGSIHSKNIRQLKLQGFSQLQTARKLSISLSTVKRHWDKGIVDLTAE